MHHYDLFGGGWMMFVWWFIIILLLVFAVRAIMNFSRGTPDQQKETPMEILERRYAEGEIDEEEFNRRKKELQK